VFAGLAFKRDDPEFRKRFGYNVRFGYKVKHADELSR
jgi:hypothetical protein